MPAWQTAALRHERCTRRHNWKLISGTTVFVQPWQYRSAMRALNGRELKPYHVVVAKSLEYLLEESLAPIGKGV